MKHVSRVNVEAAHNETCFIQGYLWMKHTGMFHVRVYVDETHNEAIRVYVDETHNETDVSRTGMYNERGVSCTVYVDEVHNEICFIYGYLWMKNK
jgi:hypothetical protein